MKWLSSIVLLLHGFSNMAQGYDEDTKTLESIGKVYYEIVSGPIGQARDFDRLRNLFHPNATLTYSYWSEEEQANKLMPMDIEGYIEKLDYLDKKGSTKKNCLFPPNRTAPSRSQSARTSFGWGIKRQKDGGLPATNTSGTAHAIGSCPCSG